MLALGHRPMNTIRLRIAVLGCIAPSLIAMLTLNREDESPQCGPVWGRVSYKGRPLQQGAILFAPVGAEPGDWAIGPIGKDGRYSMNPNWHRGYAEKVHYRLCIVPFPHAFTAEDLSPPREELPSDTKPAAPPGETPDAHQQTLAALPIPERFTKIWTSGLKVTLDRSSARVDIDLKD